MSKLYLASTAEGKTWSFGLVKQPKRPAFWSAIEGEVERTEYEGVGFTSFKFMMFQARTRKQLLDGKATDKNKQAALAKLIDSMKAEGLIKEAA